MFLMFMQLYNHLNLGRCDRAQHNYYARFTTAGFLRAVRGAGDARANDPASHAGISTRRRSSAMYASNTAGLVR
jgi:hypothetical protein